MLCPTLPHWVKGFSSVSLPWSWLGCEPTEHEFATVKAGKLYKAPQSEKKLLHLQYDTKQQDTKLQYKHWAKAIQISEKYEDVEPAFLVLWRSASLRGTPISVKLK